MDEKMAGLTSMYQWTQTNGQPGMCFVYLVILLCQQVHVLETLLITTPRRSLRVG
jgi:hypothetical protein